MQRDFVRATELPPKEHLGRWWMHNLVRLTLYLLVASVLTALGLLGSAFLAGTMLIFFYGGVVCLPGTLLWLTAVSQYPPEWPRLRRRAIAVVTGPVIGALWIAAFAQISFWPGVAIWGVPLPMGSGLVVSLRQRNRQISRR